MLWVQPVPFPQFQREGQNHLWFVALIRQLTFVWGTIDPLCVTMITPADTEGRTDGKTKSRLSLLDVSVVAAALQQHRLSSSSVRNQVCVAKETSAKLPAMTEQREPFCFIDCSSFMLVRDSHIREFDSNHKFWRGCKRKTHVPVVCLQNIFFYTCKQMCICLPLTHGLSHMYMSDCFCEVGGKLKKKVRKCWICINWVGIKSCFVFLF